MSGILSPDPRLRELTALGVVAPGAKLHTYVAGTPSTPIVTYNNVDLAAGHENANPIVADPSGLFGPIYLTPGLSYKYVLTDASDVEIWTQDNIRADVTPVVTEANLTLSDVMTDDVSIARHGFAPKAPNDATQFLNGLGAYSVPSAGTLVFDRLKTGSGISNAAGATDVDTVAITGLTVNDTLRVIAVLESATQATAAPSLRNSTDPATIGLASANLAAGDAGVYIWEFGVRQTDSKKVVCSLLDSTLPAGGTTQFNVNTKVTFTTDWTGNWTLALRHGGVTAGGTFAYRWRVFKMAGQ